VVNNSNFIVVTGGATGTASDAVSIQVPANTGAARTGTLIIAGQIVTITQSAYTLVPAPSNPSPANGATGISIAPTLSWSASSGPTPYDVYFGTSANPSLATNTTSTSYVPGSLNPGATYYWKVVAKNSGGSNSSAVWSFTTYSASVTVVPLTSYYNRLGIVTDGSTFSGGGLDGYGFAYSSNLLGTSDTFGSATFTFGPANQSSAVSNATIALPAGQYATLNLVGTGVNGRQPAQTFVVTYSDGTTSTFSQGLSDWYTPSSFSGETIELAMAHRDRYNGTEVDATFHLYGYSFALNSAKTVSSIKLPANSNVAVLSMALGP